MDWSNYEVEGQISIFDLMEAENPKKKMKVLVACEESQRVCIEFRKRGHEAYSCDIEECSGGHPEWHIQNNVLNVLNPCDDGELIAISFSTMDDEIHIVEKWDMIIAFPPCTYLTVTGNRWFNVEKYGDKAIQRHKERELAIDFFMKFANADCEKIAIENPIGCMSTHFRKPNQVIQPWQFGHPTTKSTCLWLKGLPELKPTNIVEIDKTDVYEYVAKNGRIKHDSRNRSKCKTSERSKYRSKTFPGIAKAMAEQWG